MDAARAIAVRRASAAVRALSPDQDATALPQKAQVQQRCSDQYRTGRTRQGNQLINSVLRKPHIRNPNFPKRLIEKRLPSLTFRIADRDENGAKALAEVEAREINLAEPLQTRFGEELYTQIFTSQRVALAAPTTYCVAQPRTARRP
jgi:hypothetical protein